MLTGRVLDFHNKYIHRLGRPNAGQIVVEIIFQVHKPKEKKLNKPHREGGPLLYGKSNKMGSLKKEYFNSHILPFQLAIKTHPS